MHGTHFDFGELTILIFTDVIFFGSRYNKDKRLHAECVLSYPGTILIPCQSYNYMLWASKIRGLCLVLCPERNTSKVALFLEGKNLCFVFLYLYPYSIVMLNEMKKTKSYLYKNFGEF